MKKLRNLTFKKATKIGIMSTKLFWNTAKPYDKILTEDKMLTNDKIVIESEDDVKIKSKGKNSVLDIKAGNVINGEEIC